MMTCTRRNTVLGLGSEDCCKHDGNTGCCHQVEVLSPEWPGVRAALCLFTGGFRSEPSADNPCGVSPGLQTASLASWLAPCSAPCPRCHVWADPAMTAQHIRLLLHPAPFFLTLLPLQSNLPNVATAPCIYVWSPPCSGTNMLIPQHWL